LEALIPTFYAALYDSIAAHSRHGLNVVVDVDHHDAYSRRLNTLRDGARRLIGLPVLVVGVRCPIEVIMERRGAKAGAQVPEPVLRWQQEVHHPGIYDMVVDTSAMSADQCAARIGDRLRGPTGVAIEALAAHE
jgi:chloramphenicol 3-O phosphotransferase